MLPGVMVIPDPLSPEEHLDLGLAYEREGKLDLALREYEAAGSIPLAVLGKGNVLFQQGQYRRAEAAYRRLLRGDLMPEAANNLAFMLILEGRDPERAAELAERAVEEAIKRNLDEAQIRNFKNTQNQAETALMNSRSVRPAGAGPAGGPAGDPPPGEAGGGTAGESPGVPGDGTAGASRAGGAENGPGAEAGPVLRAGSGGGG
jgi:tetratricopeptide (TPR) repeat protein